MISLIWFTLLSRKFKCASTDWLLVVLTVDMSGNTWFQSTTLNMFVLIIGPTIFGLGLT
jgi:hypothetical protein